MPLDPLDPRHFSLSPEQRHADQMASAARQLGALQRNSLLLNTVARASGGFANDSGSPADRLVIFGAWVFHISGIGSTWGVGVNGVSSIGTGLVQATLTETFTVDTLAGTPFPRYAVGALVLGSTAATVRVTASDSTTITFQTLNSAGTAVDSHFMFVGAGTLPAA